MLNAQVPVSLLAKASRSTSWLERYAIAKHQNTPPLILKRLGEDGNRIVRATARENPNYQE